MKRIIILAVALTAGLSSCDLLDTKPMSQMTQTDYFKTETDLQLFTNPLYNNMLDKDPYDDQSDLMVCQTLSDEILGGNKRTVPNSGGGWTWTDLRRINTLLEYADQCDDKDAVTHYTALADETVVSLPNVVVMTLTTDGFVVSDTENSGNVYVINSTAVNIGDNLSLRGTKGSDTQSLAIVECDQVEVLSTGGKVTYPAAEDITSKIDTYDPKDRTYVSVDGVLSGTNIVVEGAQYSVAVTNAPESMNLAALNGHKVTARGYFAGVAAPVIRITLSEIEDKGIFKEIYYAEDFEWLDPWALAVGAGRTVEDDNLDAYCPQLPTPKVDGVSALDALEAKGYEFLRVTTKTEGECIYLQQNYLKFGKTGYQAGIVLPSMDNVPAGTKLTLSFDWCPMRQGSGKVDPVNLLVVVSNGDKELASYDVPEAGWADGHKLEWIRAEVAIEGVDITPETRITIRQTQWPEATANRWFLDNIELSKSL